MVMGERFQQEKDEDVRKHAVDVDAQSSKARKWSQAGIASTSDAGIVVNMEDEPSADFVPSNADSASSPLFTPHSPQKNSGRNQVQIGNPPAQQGLLSSTKKNHQ